MKIEAMAAVKMVKQYDVGKAIEVLQAIMVLIEYLDRASDAGRTLGLDGHSFRFCERCADNSDRLPISHFLLLCISDDANQNGLASQPGPVMHRTQQYSKQIPREVFG
jgi:hypothetical protein